MSKGLSDERCNAGTMPTFPSTLFSASSRTSIQQSKKPNDVTGSTATSPELPGSLNPTPNSAAHLHRNKLGNCSALRRGIASKRRSS